MEHKANILVVDDQRSMRLTLGTILEDKGYGVDMVEDGYQAIEAVKKTAYDIIFMDIRMPGIDGVQTFREIKKISPQAMVIMMTAYSVEDLIKKALQEGAYAVVYKPFEMERVIDIITKALTNTLILIVDDRVGDRQTLKAILDDKGYCTGLAKDGYEAVQKVKEDHYDIIFIDVKMPGMDGIETYVAVKKIAPEIGVIMMSGYSVEELVEKSLEADSYAYIHKPFEMDRLIGLVEKILRAKRKNVS